MAPESPAPVVEVRALVKDFPEVRAGDDVSFAIGRGTCFGLLGPNGAGKTTTIEVVEGILRPTAGEVLYKGAPRTAGFREEVGIQFQNTELPQYLTVKETLLTFRNLYDRKADLVALGAAHRRHGALQQGHDDGHGRRRRGEGNQHAQERPDHGDASSTGGHRPRRVASAQHATAGGPRQ